MIKHKGLITFKPCVGLGDAVYAYPIIKYYSELYPNCNFKVITKYKEVFECIEKVSCDTETNFFNIDCRYLNRKDKKSNQFEDICFNARIKKKIEFKIEIYKNKIDINNKNKKILLVRNPYLGMELRKTPILTPDFKKIDIILNFLKKYYYIVLLRHDEDGTDVYLKNYNEIFENTTINQLLNLVDCSDLILSQNGHILAIAEALNKKIISIFSSNLINCEDDFFRTITPSKVITKPTSYYCYDNNISLVEKTLLANI